MLLCFIVILFICVVVGVIKYSTAHSLKQEKDIKLSTIDNEKFTMEKYYTDSKPLLIIYFHPECYFCSMYNPQNEMFARFGTKCYPTQNETFFF